MRKKLAIMAACLIGMAGQAHAALTFISVSGTVNGTQSTIACDRGSAPSCFSSNPGGVSSQPYANMFALPTFAQDLTEGDNELRYGSASEGLYTGVINLTNGVLTGRDLNFSREDPGVRDGARGSSFITASANSFLVTAIAPVPEPATWAMMLFGFAAVGTALRRAPRRALLPA